MHHTIITDQTALKSFIDWLPSLDEHEKFYCCLLARKKYSDGPAKSKDEKQLRRFLSTKDRLYEKILQLEVPVGAYRFKEEAVPQAALALYINPNPRNLKTAAYDGIIKLAESLKHDKKSYNPHAEMMSCIQRGKGRNVYLDFDLDAKPFDFDRLKAVINPDCLRVVETRGGYHILVSVDNVAPAYKKGFFNNIIKLGVDKSGDQLLPVPGCVQGGFTPRFIDI